MLTPRTRGRLSSTIWMKVPRFCRSEEHTSELQSLRHLVCRLLLEKKKKNGTARLASAPENTLTYTVTMKKEGTMKNEGAAKATLNTMHTQTQAGRSSKQNMQRRAV